MGVSKQRGGEAEPTVHPHREAAQSLVPEPGEADDFEDLVGPGRGHTRGRAEHTKLPSGGTGGMARYVAEQDAHFPRRVGDAVQRPPPEVGNASPRVQFEHQPQGRGPARPGAPSKAVTRPGEPRRSDRSRRAERRDGGAGESDGLEHRFSRVSRGR